MFLAINIGNSSIWLGVFDNNELIRTFRLESKGKYNYEQLLKINLKGFSINSIVISSVVPFHNKVFERVCIKLFKTKPQFVHKLVDLGELGADIYCNTLAAKKIYGTPVLVVDLGTATTFDAVDKNGKYLGSAIAPGMQIAHKALIEQTALLHEVELKAPKSVIGTNTTTAIQSGVVLGYVDLVEGMVKRFKKELGEKTKVIATGGLSNIIAEHTNVLDEVDPYLTLRGIQILST